MSILNLAVIERPNQEYGGDPEDTLNTEVSKTKRMEPLRRTFHSLVGRAVEWSLPKLSSKLGQLAEHFPDWNIRPILAAQLELNSLIREARDKDLLSENAASLDVTNSAIILDALKGKSSHSLAVVGSICQGELPPNHFELARLTTGIEVCLVDLPDSLGDQGGRRSRLDSQKMYGLAEKMFSGESIQRNTRFKDADDPRQPLLGLLADYATRYQRGVTQVVGRVEHEEAQEAIRGTCAAVARSYGWCVEIMHIQDKEKQTDVAQNLYDQAIATPNYYIPPEIDDPIAFYNSGGSPLGAMAVINEAFRNPNEISVDDIVEIGRFFNHNIPFLHVLLDDMQDQRQDKEQGDPNLFTRFLEGEADELLDQTAKAYFPGLDLDSTNNNEEKLLLYFKAHGIVHRRKAEELIYVLGAERADTHLRLARDMYQFYLLRMQRDHKKTGDFADDSLEMKCINALLDEVDQIDFAG